MLRGTDVPARRLLILLVCAFVFAAGCSGSSEPSEDLYGVWLTPDNSNHLSFNEDDTWSFSHAEDPVDVFQNRGFGAFTYDGELLTLFTDVASKNCSPTSGAFTEVITGTYEATITPEGNLELTDVDDLCTPRKVEFRGTRTNVDQPHSTGILVPYSGVRPPTPS